jgi:hypothetical protein
VDGDLNQRRLRMGKCPKCEIQVTRILVDEVPIDANYPQNWRGVSYRCPFCDAILGVQIDPIAIKTELLSEKIAALGK